MNAVLICYTLEKAQQTQRTALKRALSGYKDISNKGNYTYQREGALHEIPHLKPHNSVIITKTEYKNKILKILKKYKATVKQYKIQINHPKIA